MSFYSYAARRTAGLLSAFFLSICVFQFGTGTPSRTYVDPIFQETPAGSVNLRTLTVFWGSTGRQIVDDVLGETTVDFTYSYPSTSVCNGRQTFDITLSTPGGQALGKASLVNPTVTSSSPLPITFPTILLIADSPLASQILTVNWECRYNLMDGFGYRYARATSESNIYFGAPDVPNVSGVSLTKSNVGKKRQVIIDWDAHHAITRMSGGDTVYLYRFSKANKRSTFGPWMSTDIPLAYKKLAKKSKYSFQVQIVTPYGYSEITTVKFKT